MPFLATSYHLFAKRCLVSFVFVEQVADVLFRVTDEPLRSNSQAFAGQFLPHHIPFGTCIGTDDAPIVIDGVEPYEFDRLLGVIYPPCVTCHILYLRLTFVAGSTATGLLSSQTMALRNGLWSLTLPTSGASMPYITMLFITS
jgi:hypothetical protein